MSSKERSQERRRRRRSEKHSEVSEQRRIAASFVATCRRLAQGGWFEAVGISADDESLDRDEWRSTVDRLCGLYGVTSGDPRSWRLVDQLIADAGAPLATRRLVVEKWSRLHPQDPTPRVWCALDRLERGAADDALRLIRQGLDGPGGAALERLLGEFRRSNGVDLVTIIEARVARAKVADPRGSPSPAWAGSPAGGARKTSRAARPGPARESPPKAPSRSGPVLAPAERAVVERIQSTARALPEVASVVFEPTRLDTILERLRRGPYDTPESLELCRRGVELSAADHYDRLLSLDALRGVDRLGYQIETVFRVLKRFRGRVLLADEVGLGKTIEAGIILKEYLMRRQVRRALVLVPPALVGQWEAELEEKFSIPTVSTRSPELRSDPGAFWTAPGVIVASLATARADPHREHVVREPFDLVIVDEAHHLKNRRSRGWELVNSLRSTFFLMLTATPVETDLTELYNLVTLLRPGTLGTEAEFRRRFVNPDDPMQPVDPGRLRDLLREVMVRNTRALCGIQLPPRTVRTITVEPFPEERELYDRLVEAARLQRGHRRALFRLLLEEGGSSPWAVARTAARALESMGDDPARATLIEVAAAARRVERTKKLDLLAEILRGDRTLVFTRFRETMTQIAEYLDRIGVRWIAFHGGMSGPAKDAAVAAFAGRDVPVMVCSEIGGEGRNLQFCHRLVNFDLPWNPMSIEQRVGRIHRIGQTETVEVVNLVALGTAEERILDVLDSRIRMFELVIGEVDLLLGDLEDEREFGDRVFDIYADSRSADDVLRGFDELGDRLLERRRKLDKTRALDEALFGEDYEA